MSRAGAETGEAPEVPDLSETLEQPETADAMVRSAAAVLTEAGVPSPRRDAVLLLAHVLGVDAGEAERAVLLRRPLEERSRSRFASYVDERRSRVPLQHLTGTAPFRHLELSVGPGVFVPRPETEAVAGAVVERLTDAAAQNWSRRPVVVDLCTGSGAIALAVATEVPCAVVVGVELSPEAFAWAARNRDRLCPRVELRQGDATDAAVCADLAGLADLVVSNPPYIPPGAVPVDPEVRDHDPDLALYGRGDDGLEVPRRVAAVAAVLLRPGGRFVMEHAEVQGDALVDHLTRDGRWGDVRDRADHTGRPRFVEATLLDLRHRGEQPVRGDNA